MGIGCCNDWCIDIRARTQCQTTRDSCFFQSSLHLVFGYSIIIDVMQPTVNPMLGPSESALINLGARFPPCMKDVAAVPVTLELPCE